MAKYTPVAYDDKKYSKGINTAFYNKAISDYTTQANNQRATEIQQADKSRVDQIRQAYIQNMQNQRTLNENLATAGIRGGMTETAQLNLANQYGNARATANTNYANAVNEINKATDQNIADYKSDMLSRAEEYRQNLAQARWQAAREDKMNQRNATTDYWNNYYTNYYSGSSKKNLNKALKTAKKNLANAKKKGKAMSVIKYEQQIVGIRSRLGVINNKEKK